MVLHDDDDVVHLPHHSSSSSSQLSCPVVPGSSVDEGIRHKYNKTQTCQPQFTCLSNKK